MRHIILSSEARRSVPYFSTLSHTRYNFREKKIKDLFNIKNVIFFTVLPRILMLSKYFIHQLIHNRVTLKES